MRRPVAMAWGVALALAASAEAWTVRVIQTATSPDGRFRVELADHRQETALELFVMPTGAAPGTAPRKISGPLPKDHDVSGFQISPDSQHVVYRQGQTAQVVGGNWRLYVVPIAGGQVVNLTPTLVQGGNVEPGFTILPHDRVRWVADAAVDETYQTFEASIAVRIFTDGFEGGSVGAWR